MHEKDVFGHIGFPRTFAVADATGLATMRLWPIADSPKRTLSADLDRQTRR
jgi:hypothetical protein